MRRSRLRFVVLRLPTVRITAHGLQHERTADGMVALFVESTGCWF